MGQSIGSATIKAVTRFTVENRNPEYDHRAYLGLMSLTRGYSQSRLDAKQADRISLPVHA